VRVAIAALGPVALAIGIAGIAGTANAQPAPEAPGPEPAAPSAVISPPAALEPPAPSEIDVRGDAAWQLYHQIFDAVARGRRVTARDLVAQLVRDHPGHRATYLVQRSALGDRPGTGSGATDDAGELVERPSRGARAELAGFQTLHGIAVGSELCILAECNSAGAVFGVVLLGGTVGLVASLAAGDAVTPGQRGLLNSGTAWGAVNATLVLLATQPDDPSSYAGGLLVGQIAGLGFGAALAHRGITAGQVALANSGGEWAGILAGLSMAAIGGDQDGRQVAGVLLVAVDLGIVGGAVLASHLPEVSRAQTLVIDAAGILGAVGGGSIGTVISGNASDRTTPGLAAVGAVIGLGAAAYLTRNWSEGSGSSSLQSYVMPVERGRGATAGIGGTW
jgi:hypothetical protein